MERVGERVLVMTSAMRGFAYPVRDLPYASVLGTWSRLACAFPIRHAHSFSCCVHALQESMTERCAFPSSKRPRSLTGFRSTLSVSRKGSTAFHRFYSTSAASASSARSPQMYPSSDPHDCGHSHHGHSHSHGAVEAHIQGKSLQECKRVTLVGLGTNIFFSGTKLVAGSAGGSVALMADGFHALTDIFADLISYMSMTFSRKHFPRCKFPFGIGRLETMGTVVVASVLFIGGALLLWDSLQSFVSVWNPFSGDFFLGTRDALLSTPSPSSSEGCTSSSMGPNGILDGDPSSPTSAGPHSCGHSHSHSHFGGGVGHSHFTLTTTDEAGVERIMWLMIALAGGSVICKELLYRWARRVGERAGSRVVVANAYHHRADAWSGGVTLMGLCGQSLGVPGADGLAGLVVSSCICQVGYQLTKEAVLELFDYQRMDEVREVRQRLQRFHLPTPFERQTCATHGEGDGSSAGSVKHPHKRRMVGVEECSEHGSAGAPPTSEERLLPEQMASSASTSLLWEENACDGGKGSTPAGAGFPGPCGGKAELGERVRFINVFLLRHGHTYATHVTLLACASLHAEEIARVTEQVSQLASTQLSSTNSTMTVEGAFITLLICNAENVVPRSSEEGRAGGNKSEQTPEALPSRCHTFTTTASTAALGELVQPSLERCIDALMKFHDFPSPIRYHWEKRVLLIPAGNRSYHHCCEHHSHSAKPLPSPSRSTPLEPPSMEASDSTRNSWRSVLSAFSKESKDAYTNTSEECLQDAISVAEMFNCRVEFV